MYVLPVPALASSTVTPVGSGPQMSNGRLTARSPPRRASSPRHSRSAYCPKRVGSAGSQRSSSRGGASSSAAKRRTPPNDELVLGLPVLLREAVGLPLRRARSPPAANAADVRHDERQRLAHPAVVEIDEHRQLAPAPPRATAPGSARPSPARCDASPRARPIVAASNDPPRGAQREQPHPRPEPVARVDLRVRDASSAATRARPGTVPVSRRPPTSTLTSTDRPAPPRAARAPARRSRPRPARSPAITGYPSCPGGSLPRGDLGQDRRPALRARPSPRRAAAGRRPTSRGVELDRQRVGDLVGVVADADPEPLAQERAHRVLDEPHEVLRARPARARAPAAARAGTRARRARGRTARARPPASRDRSSTAWPAPARPRVKLRGSNGCSGCRTHAPSRPDHVQQLADRDRGRARDVRALVVAGVGDDQPVARGQQRVEQQLAVLGARVAVADVRVGAASGRRRRAAPCAGTCRRRARAGRRPGAGPSASARACRSSGGRCGSSRASGGPAGARRAARGPRRARARRRGPSASSTTSSQQPLRAPSAASGSRAARVSASARGRQRLRPLRHGLRHRCSASTAAVQPVDQLREAARRGRSRRSRRRRAAARRRTAAARPRSSSRRPARGPARSRHVPGGQLLELERRAVLGVQAPADAARRRPSPRAARSSSSSSRKRRRTGSRSARSSTCEAVSRCPASSSSRATTPSTGLVWRSERSASRTRRSGGRIAGRLSSSSSSTSPAPNVAWISGANVSMSGHITITSRGSSVGSSASRCRIASRTTSTWRARPWQAWTSTLRSGRARARGAAVARARAGLQRGRACVPPRCSTGCSCVAHVRPEHELQLARVLPPRGEQAVAGQRAPWGPRARRDDARPARRDLLPQRGRGMQQEEVHVAVRRPARAGPRSWPAGRRVRPNSESRSRQRRRVSAPRAAARTRPPAAPPGPASRDPRRQAPPQLAPATASSPRASAHQLGPVQRVAVEQRREVADGGEAARAARPAGAGGAATAPRAHASTTSSSGHTSRSGSHGSVSGSIPDAAATASPVSRRGNGKSTFAQMPRRDGEALRQPALHPARGDGDDLGRERVRRRVGEQLAQGGDQAVGAVGSVDVEHRRCGDVVRGFRT